MKFSEDLLIILNNETEPLSKRLHLADSIFRSSEILLQHHESLLINWLLQFLNDSDIEPWKTLLSWLSSNQAKEFTRNDISFNVVSNLIKIIISNIKRPALDFKNVLFEISVVILESKVFQYFFKCNTDEYCKFVLATLQEVDDKVILLKLSSVDNLFNQSILDEKEFVKQFLKDGLSIFANIAIKFEGNKDVYDILSKLLGKCIFQQNIKSFGAYYASYFEDTTTEKPFIPNLFFKRLKSSTSLEVNTVRTIFKLVFRSYLRFCKNDFSSVYKYIIFNLEILGFPQEVFFNSEVIKKLRNTQMDALNSIGIIAEMFKCLPENDFELDSKVKDINFTEFLDELLVLVVNSIKTPSKDVYNFLNSLTSVEPLVVERKSDLLLPYVLLSPRKENEEGYEEFLNTVLNIYAKLHRIQNFIYSVIQLTKHHLWTPDKIEGGRVDEVRIESIFPEQFLSNFTQHVTLLASWQVMNIFKTLLFHLKEVISEDLQDATKDTKNILYIQIISTYICHLLASVRIAEHTVSEIILENFLKAMEELRDTLGNFGTALVKMEHNPSLMRAYLNICFNWGELLMVLKYYSSSMEINLRLVDNDYSECNITYLHSYLTRDQWCLISERITNFGEAPCKKIMQDLFIQKLRAVFLFEKHVSEEMQINVVRALNSNVENNWKNLVQDPFILQHIIPKMDETAILNIAELIVTDVSEGRNSDLLRERILECRLLIAAIVCTCLLKIKRLFKQKRKHDTTRVEQPLIYNFFVKFSTDLVFNSHSDSLDELDPIIEDFNSNVASNIRLSRFDFSEDMFVQRLAILEKLPITFLPKSTQTLLFISLTTILVDLNTNGLRKGSAQEHCETFLLGLMKNYKIAYTKINTDLILQVFLDDFKDYITAFAYYFEYLFKVDCTELLGVTVDFLIKRLKRCLQIVIILLHRIAKFKKTRISEMTKTVITDHQNRLFQHLLEFTEEKDNSNHSQFIEAYGLTLKYFLDKGEDDVIGRLLPELDYYVNSTLNLDRNEDGGGLQLFTVIIRNKNKLKIEDSFIIKIWNYSKELDIKTNKLDEYSELLVLIFEHVCNDDFADISQELLKNTITEFKMNKQENFAKHFKIWNAILTCNLNPIKSQRLLQVLESLLKELITYMLKYEDDICNVKDSLLEFETNIIKSVHIYLSGSLLDCVFVTISLLMSRSQDHFTNNFLVSASVLENLLRYRRIIILDRLPSFLQHYRILLRKLCLNSDVKLNLTEAEVQTVSDCSHKMERLMSSLTKSAKHIARISPYIIADVLREYEETTLHPNVKFHLNNCLYKLLPLCDQHAVSYTLRILSTASTELFKVIYENYKKYYKFTGKV